MRSKKFALPGCLLFIWFGLGGLLAACGADASPTTRPAAAPTGTAHPTVTPAPPPTATPSGPTASILALTIAPTPYITPLPEEWQPSLTTAPPPPDQTVGCFFVADYGYQPLSQQVQQSLDIVQAQVTNIGPLTWNTADGKAPPEPCSTGYHQYSPVEITLKEIYKGQLTPSSKLELWLTGAPGSVLQGNYNYFPQIGDLQIFFLGEEENVRRDTAQNPMKTRMALQVYRPQSPGSAKWVARNTSLLRSNGSKR